MNPLASSPFSSMTPTAPTLTSPAAGAGRGPQSAQDAGPQDPARRQARRQASAHEDDRFRHALARRRHGGGPTGEVPVPAPAADAPSGPQGGRGQPGRRTRLEEDPSALTDLGALAAQIGRIEAPARPVGDADLAAFSGAAGQARPRQSLVGQGTGDDGEPAGHPAGSLPGDPAGGARPGGSGPEAAAADRGAPAGPAGPAGPALASELPAFRLAQGLGAGPGAYGASLPGPVAPGDARAAALLRGSPGGPASQALRSLRGDALGTSRSSWAHAREGALSRAVLDATGPTASALAEGSAQRSDSGGRVNLAEGRSAASFAPTTTTTTTPTESATAPATHGLPSMALPQGGSPGGVGPDLAANPQGLTPAGEPAAHVAAPAAGLASPLGTQAWAQAMGQHLVRMAQVRQSSAELQLHPADLGPLQVQLELQGGEVQVRFGAQAEAVRQALEAALPQLREALAQQGLNLGQAHVGADSGSAGGQGQAPVHDRGDAGVSWSRPGRQALGTAPADPVIRPVAPGGRLHTWA